MRSRLRAVCVIAVSGRLTHPNQSWAARAALFSSMRAASAPRRPPPPPPLPGGRHRLPPPPPLGGRGDALSRGSAAPVNSNADAASALSLRSPRSGTSRGGSASGAGLTLPWKAPHEVLSALIEYVPTFYVAAPVVAAILPEETRVHFVGRGRFVNFLRRYPFFFDLRVLDSGGRVDVRLRDDVSHPQRGVADERFMMVDVGEVTNYVAKPEYIVSTDSIESLSQSVNVVPPSAPPAVRVQLEERVPVLERLCALVPPHFTPIETLEDEMPEDILFHPYFDCQGGLQSIAGKFPQHFQVVEGTVRLRPPYLAPLALNDLTLEDSPIPSVAARVREAVGTSDVPHWVGLTFLYEQLSQAERREIKKGFKSFAGFLRAHGRSLSISQDMLHVARWMPPTREAAVSSSTPSGATSGFALGASSSSSLPRPRPAPAPTSAATTRGSTNATTTDTKLDPGSTIKRSPATSTTGSPTVIHTYTQLQVINELFDRFPPGRTLTLTEALALLPQDMVSTSLPRRVLGWLASHPQYFTVEDATETDPSKACIRRASERQPLDLALAVYHVVWPLDANQGGAGATNATVTATATSAHEDEDSADPSSVATDAMQLTGNGEAMASDVLAALPERQRRVVERMGWETVANVLPEWLAVRQTFMEGKGRENVVLILQCRQSLPALEQAIRNEESKQAL